MLMADLSIVVNGRSHSVSVDSDMPLLWILRDALQRAWIDEDVSQCGYCQAGMILTTAALLKAKPNASDADIDAALDQHVCRCGTYPRIRRAIHRIVRGAP